jgi:hypothetical protein
MLFQVNLFKVSFPILGCFTLKYFIIILGFKLSYCKKISTILNDSTLCYSMLFHLTLLSIIIGYPTLCYSKVFYYVFSFMNLPWAT